MSVSINVRNSVENQFVHNLTYIHTPCLLLHYSGRIVACNRDFLTLSGYTTDQLARLNLFSNILSGIEDIDHFKETVKNNKHNSIKWKGDGQSLTSRLQPLFIPNEEHPSCYTYLQFLPDHQLLPKVTQPKLISFFSEQLFTHSHHALILFDQEGEVVRMTKAAAEILGGEVEEYVGRNILDYFSSLPYDNQLVQRNFFEGGSIRNKEMLWNNGRKESELLIDSFPIYDQLNELIGVSVFIKDVTNIRSLENQIRRNDRLAMIGQIAAGTAHEIRNPLTSIKGFLQVMKKTLLEYKLTREVSYTDIMLEEIERINQLVGEFLLLSRSKETKYEIISLHDLMNQFLPILSNEALLNGIEVYHQSVKSLPKVIGNKDLLKQVFLNICKNGIEAMGEKGEIRITYQLIPEEKKISINFADNGPGIPPYVLDKIFDPFFTTKEEGTGLGLSVCHRIIHDMGGNIFVSSNTYKTIFQVQIPYLDS